MVTFRSSLRSSPSLLLGLLLCAYVVIAEEVSFYKSVSVPAGHVRFEAPGKLISGQLQRPDIYPPVLHIEHSEPSKLAPGYIFITPYESQNPGPYIFDNSGV